MTTELAVSAWTDEKVALLKRTICKDATDDEMQMFLSICRTRNLDPFAKEIYFRKYKNRQTGEATVTIITGIDGFRALAQSSGLYEGQAPPQWCGPDGEWKDVWLSKDFPAAARVGVYRVGHREPIYAIAKWSEYFPANERDQFMWKRMGTNQLSKCAEALALRKAFPRQLGSIHTDDEMAQADAYEPPREVALDIGAHAGDGASPKAHAAGAATKAQLNTSTSGAVPATSAATASTSSSGASKSPRTAADIKHDGNLANRAQIAKLHVMQPQITTLWRCAKDKPCPWIDGKAPHNKACGYHGKLAVYRDQRGERIRASNELSSDQIGYFLDWCETVVAKRVVDEPSEIVGERPPTEDDEPAEKADIDALELAAFARWGTGYAKEFSSWLKGAFEHETVFDLTKQEARDAATMIRDGK